MRRDPKLYRIFMVDRCEACGRSHTDFNPLDPDHVKTLGSGGENAAWNILTLCREHHIEKGWSLNKFVEKYPTVKKWLLDRGWEFCSFRKKWIH